MKKGIRWLLPLTLGLGLIAAGVMARPAATQPAADPSSEGLASAVFAGGCFWCVEADFEKLPGVAEAISGYTGGDLPNPTYEKVSAGGTGHLEAVTVYYDPDAIGYGELVEAYWRMIDPTDGEGQFGDRGDSYRPAIFPGSEEERRIALASRERLAKSGRFTAPVEVEILPRGKFWPAEKRHQDYYKEHAYSYRFYRYLSGRDQFIASAWQEDAGMKPTQVAQAGKYTRPPEEELKQRLSPLQYKVTRKEGTEPPFENEYWDEKRDGIYVDIVSGEPLFSSRDKFASGTGWPSFTRPLEPDHIVEKKDFRLIWPRTEVRSKIGDSHLGHVFDDGPEPTGLRYCVNSAALRFIPKEKLEEEGYGEYLAQFESTPTEY